MARRIALIVKPGSAKSGLIVFDEARQAYIVSISAPADRGRANAELINLLSRHFKSPVRIVSGFASRRKVVEV